MRVVCRDFCGLMYRRENNWSEKGRNVIRYFHKKTLNGRQLQKVCEKRGRESIGTEVHK